MRIAIVCPYDLGIPGGVQNQALGIGEALVREGHRVIVIAPGASGEAVPSSLVPIEFVGRTIALAANGSVARISLSPRSLTRTRKVIARFAPDIVHCHEPFVPGPALGALLGGGPPLVATFHRSGVSPSYKMLRYLVRHELGHMSARVAVSSEAMQTIEAVVGTDLSDIEIISNGVDLKAFDDVEAVPTEHRTVIFVGRHEERKGLRILLEAMRIIDDAITLWVVGDGPLTPTLKRDSRDLRNVEWLGVLSQAQLRSRLASADLFVAPSISGESFGVVLLEAMAARTAVLASDLPGYRLAGGEGARHVAPRDARLLAEEIKRVIADGSLREKLVAAGTMHVRSFDFPAIADQYLRVFNRVCSEQERRRSQPGQRGRKNLTTR